MKKHIAKSMIVSLVGGAISGAIGLAIDRWSYRGHYDNQKKFKKNK